MQSRVSLNHVVMSKYIFECFKSFSVMFVKRCDMKLRKYDLLLNNETTKAKFNVL